ncbi:MMPL family transporter [Streptomyces lunalinharesii]|uniref:MMPL family transporter n=1 Tax=Streptomyces lunalinharesii TaxID=333384 RepID=A0ABN3RTX5_9ACTN
MSVLLYKLGRFAYARPWFVIAGWAAIAAAVVSLLVVNPVKLSNEVRIDGTPAQKVIDDLAKDMPEASGGQGMLVFRARDGGRIDRPASHGALRAAVDAVYRHEHVVDARKALAQQADKGSAHPLARAQDSVAEAAGPPKTTTPPVPLLGAGGRPLPGVLVSADGSTAMLQFQFDEQTYELPAGTIDRLVEAARQQADRGHLEVLPSATMMEMPEVVGVGEIVGLVVAALVLLIALGSLVAAGLPLLVAMTGVVIGVGGTFALSGVLEIHSLTVMLALMLGLAVGIDYALFIINRQRRLILDDGLSAREAAARALGTAGSAVFFAGGTVIIALAGLLVVGITLLTSMALAAAATIAIAVLLALTFLPAVLGLVKEDICSARARARAHEQVGNSARRATRWGDALVRRRGPVFLVTCLVTLALAAPAVDMQLGLPSGASYHSDTPQRQNYQAVSAAFGPGYNGPLMVVARSAERGRPLTPQSLAAIARELKAAEGADSVSLAAMNSTGNTALFGLVPQRGPNDEGTKQLAATVRAQSHSLDAAHGVTLGITGFTALAIDVSDRLADVLPLYLMTVLGLSLVVLLLVFRSLLIPLMATAGFLLSVTATFGVTTAVFQWGWLQPLIGLDATTPVVSLLPVIVTGVLYGLAMDYQVFLVTSMREAHVRGADPVRATVFGFAQASRVVIAAATIMVAVFSGFVFNGQPMIKQLGFALAVGILIDAFVIRMTFVPAAMALARGKAWWLPAWLDRIVPDLDVEGDKLDLRLSTPDAGARREGHRTTR